jgi:ABC-type multidrug transport system ATPase subunit
MLTGLLPPTFGEAYIEGNSIRTAMDAARANISICPQHDMLLEEITGRQHLEIFARLKGVPPSELSFRIDQALADVDLTSKQNDAVKTYSGGMKRRLSLAISLVADSAVVFLDEPTSGLDPGS